MWAIISDVHANLPALEAVLDDIGRFAVQRIICLGDVVGYGPDPCPCVDLVSHVADLCLLGDHDQEAILAPIGSAQVWAMGFVFTRNQLDAWRANRGRRLDFFFGRGSQAIEEPVCFVHGSPRDPLRGAIFQEDIHRGGKLRRAFDAGRRINFCGHTHVPGAFVRSGRKGFTWINPARQATVVVGADPILVNVGSVGQPRDSDVRASYVLFDGNQVTFRRVRYDVTETARRIRATPELDDFLADRLLNGR